MDRRHSRSGTSGFNVCCGNGHFQRSQMCATISGAFASLVSTKRLSPATQGRANGHPPADDEPGLRKHLEQWRHAHTRQFRGHHLDTPTSGKPLAMPLNGIALVQLAPSSPPSSRRTSIFRSSEDLPRWKMPKRPTPYFSFGFRSDFFAQVPTSLVSGWTGVPDRQDSILHEKLRGTQGSFLLVPQTASCGAQRGEAPGAWFHRLSL